jgi:hypothetical protein
MVLLSEVDIPVASRLTRSCLSCVLKVFSVQNDYGMLMSSLGNCVHYQALGNEEQGDYAMALHI